jgi:hypothetical protein
MAKSRSAISASNGAIAKKGAGMTRRGTKKATPTFKTRNVNRIKPYDTPEIVDLDIVDSDNNRTFESISSIGRTTRDSSYSRSSSNIWPSAPMNYDHRTPNIPSRYFSQRESVSRDRDLEHRVPEPIRDQPTVIIQDDKNEIIDLIKDQKREVVALLTNQIEQLTKQRESEVARNEETDKRNQENNLKLVALIMDKSIELTKANK